MVKVGNRRDLRERRLRFQSATTTRKSSTRNIEIVCDTLGDDFGHRNSPTISELYKRCITILHRHSLGADHVESALVAPPR